MPGLKRAAASASLVTGPGTASFQRTLGSSDPREGRRLSVRECLTVALRAPPSGRDPATLRGVDKAPAGLAGGPGLGQPVVIPLSRQIRSNSTSPPLPNRSVNCSPLSLSTSARPTRRHGKSDPLDAMSAAPGRAVWPGPGCAQGPGRRGGGETRRQRPSSLCSPTRSRTRSPRGSRRCSSSGVRVPAPCRRDGLGDRRVERTSRRGQWIHLLIIARRPRQQCRIGRDAVEVLAPLGAAVFADPGDQFVPALIVI